MRKGRWIADYHGTLNGPLLIAIGAMHGNEISGVKAIDLVQKMLEVEPITNPEFQYRGDFVGLIGNLAAYRMHQRFLDYDLNRMWDTDIIAEIKSGTASEKYGHEAEELQELLQILQNIVKERNPSQIVVLDLHTTSSSGGIFAIPGHDDWSIQIAASIHAPVIEGILDGIAGTSLHFFNESLFGVPTGCVAFEAGQHDDPKSINRNIAAIINVMKIIGSVKDNDVENIHDELLKAYAESLPLVSKVIYKYHVDDNEAFEMQPGFKNFQVVEQGQLIATDKGMPVRAEANGRILMPLYQKKGADGFFIIQDVKSK